MASYYPVLNDLLQLEIVCRRGAQTAYNIRHFVVSGLSTGGVREEDIADYFDTAMETWYKALLSPLAEYYGCSIQKVNAPARVLIGSKTVGGPGTATGDELPAQTAALIKLTTGLAGRRQRGHMYLPFLTEDTAHDCFTLSPSGKNAVQNIGLALIKQHTVTVFGGATVLDPVIAHTPRFTGGHTAITAFEVQNGLATRRSRGYYGRPNVPVF